MGPRGQEPNESTDDAVWQDLVARLEGTASDPLATEASPRAQEPPAGAPGARPEGRGVHRTDAAGAAPAARGGGEPDGLTDRERADAIFRNQPFASAGPRDYVAPEEPEEDDEDADLWQTALREAREVFERDYLIAQISRFSGNISRTAEFVGMERSALHRKLKALGVG